MSEKDVFVRPPAYVGSVESEWDKVEVLFGKLKATAQKLESAEMHNSIDELRNLVLTDAQSNV